MGSDPSAAACAVRTVQSRSVSKPGQRHEEAFRVDSRKAAHRETANRG